MRVSRVTPFLVAARPSTDGWSKGQIMIFVKLEADNGLVGWGEAYALEHRQYAIRDIILALGAAVMQMENASPREFVDRVALSMDSDHPSIDYASAVSAIEIALWDLLGKAAGLPLHALLGGALIDKVPLYANAWDEPVQTAQAVADRCGMMTRRGYRAVKIYPLRRANLVEAEACVRLTRQAVGPDVDLLIDFAIQKDPRHALRAVKLFEPYNPYWIEEPVAGDDPTGMAEIRAATTCRITTGERQSGLRHYRSLLSSRAADVLNPDIAGAGGILKMLEIGALADAHGAQISPHNWNSTTVAFLAMLHVCAVMRNATYAELYYDYLELGVTFAQSDYAITDGYASLPQKPGLGVEMNEAMLLSLAPALSTP
jgi:galactonate dehydratase